MFRTPSEPTQNICPFETTARAKTRTDQNRIEPEVRSHVVHTRIRFQQVEMASRLPPDRITPVIMAIVLSDRLSGSTAEQKCQHR